MGIVGIVVASLIIFLLKWYYDRWDIVSKKKERELESELSNHMIFRAMVQGKTELLNENWDPKYTLRTFEENFPNGIFAYCEKMKETFKGVTDVLNETNVRLESHAKALDELENAVKSIKLPETKHLASKGDVSKVVEGMESLRRATLNELQSQNSRIQALESEQKARKRKIEKLRGMSLGGVGKSVYSGTV